jgi:hypothetical protein
VGNPAFAEAKKKPPADAPGSAALKSPGRSGVEVSFGRPALMDETSAGSGPGHDFGQMQVTGGEAKAGAQAAPAGSPAAQSFEKQFAQRYKDIRARLPKGEDLLPADPFGEGGQDALAPKGPVSGHTEARTVHGWGTGFNALQNYLNQSTGWTDAHEEAQSLIRDYAMWKLRQSPGDVPENVKEFTKYIGRGEAGAKATDLYNYRRRQEKKEEVPRPVDLGGYAGAADWCAAASSQAFLNQLLAHGLTVGDYDKWLSKGSGRSLHFVDKDAYDAPIAPGDVITIITTVTPLTGHVATVADYDPGTKRILIVSGNAGGGGGPGIGTIRFDEVTRETPPKDYVYSEVAELGKKQVRLERKETQIKKGTATEARILVEDPALGMSRTEVDPAKQKAALAQTGQQIKEVKQDPKLQTRIATDQAAAYSPRPTTSGVAWVTRIYRLSKLMKPGTLDQMSKEDLAALGIVRRQPRPKGK